MKRFIATVSPEGTIELPPEVRDELRLKPSDRVSIVVENHQATISPLPDLEKWAGSIPALDPPRSWDEVREVAWEEATQRFKK